MSMDSAMDSLSSEHSLASSNESSVRVRSPQAHHNNGNGYKNHLVTNHYDKNHSTSPPISPSNQKPLTPSHMISIQHPLSPPHVSTPSNQHLVGMPPRIAQSLSHLPPHSLGLLNSLQMMHHASPLDLMAAAHHQMPPRSYNSPPPISSSDPTANECKLVDYRGQKVAAFIIQGDTMLCLPQAFELFLKHLVGGLHTVYTKLKRLDIVPLVCNVEQVRILRGLGAIQPGVNRCKLLACKDFDVLYRDCTTARCLSIKPPESSRPGRPPKRGPVGLSLPASHLTHHSQLKKHRLDNGDYAYENGHLSDVSRMDKSPLLANGYNAPPTHLNHMPFMQLNHHTGSPHALISPGMPPHHHNLTRSDGSVMKSPTIPGMEAIARSGIWENCRAAYEDIVKHLERLRDDREERPIDPDQKPRDLRSHNASPMGQSPVLNLSKSGNDPGSVGEPSDRSDMHSPEPSVHEDDDNISDGNMSETERNEKDDVGISDNERELPSTPSKQRNNNALDSQQIVNYSSTAAGTPIENTAPINQESNLSSTETLLRNIQGLLKVAADNARQQERKLTFEKAELKMDVLREREVKDSLDRQLADERKLRVLYQKRLKKEKHLRRQESLENEMKIKQLENALKATGASAETLKLITEIKNHSEQNDMMVINSAEPHSGSPVNVSRPSSKDISTTSSLQQLHANESSKTWNYSGIDIMSSGAFWQNYQDSLVQEIELERKVRQQGGEADVKNSLQDRPNYYNKSSVLYTNAT